MPRSIFAIRSWCRRIMVATATTPPTMMAVIGTSNPPKLTIESTSLTNASVRQELSANVYWPTLIGKRLLANAYWPTTGFLVELTGIEPVASWLQTRRSPS